MGEASNEASVALPRYRCHKEVYAAKIVRIEGLRLGLSLSGDLREDARVEVPQQWMDKHDPRVGGYYVQYEDGYQSFSPAKAFEDGYTRI